MVQRGHAFAIVDEVDSILIDEARTPLIISGQGEESTQLYTIADSFVGPSDGQEGGQRGRQSRRRTPTRPPTTSWTRRPAPSPSPPGAWQRPSSTSAWRTWPTRKTPPSAHHINQAIRARGLMKRDIDYVVKDGEVIIVDEFTGRLMFGRRYTEGLHQAIEAKEGVTVARESKTLATITFQNYFRLYDKLSGMTGTAMTEEEEFGDIYNLDVVEIPTNKPLARKDHPDVVYKNEAGKYRAVIRADRGVPRQGPAGTGGHHLHREVRAAVQAAQDKRASSHNVLNAKNHEKEAEIVAQAGKLGRRHRGHQHGRPRHRHHAGRQRRVSGQGRAAQGGL